MSGKRVSQWAVRFAIVKDGTCRRVIRLPEPMKPGPAHRWVRRHYGERAAIWLHADAPAEMRKVLA